MNKDKVALYLLECAVEKRLSASRMAHTRRVRDEALCILDTLLPFLPLSRYERENTPAFRESLAAAALLHDVTKEESFEKQLQLLQKSAIMTDAQEAARFSPVLHAFTAACVIPDLFPEYARKDVLDAVYYHTTGTENMSLMTTIVFLADYIEKGRTFTSCIAARQFFYDKKDIKNEAEALLHLNKTVLLVLERTVSYLGKKGQPIHPATCKALDFYRSITGAK